MKILKEIIPYIIVVIVVVLIRTFLVTPIRVNGSSMYPTLKDKEIMILNKIGKTVNGIDRFDIIVLKEDDYLIKRVIALPGEKISCQNGNVYINGKKLKDKYGSGLTYDFEPIEVPKDSYFVMGDNRENSKDSRYIGPINKNEIKGKTSFILFPFKNFGKVD